MIISDGYWGNMTPQQWDARVRVALWGDEGKGPIDLLASTWRGAGHVIDAMRAKGFLLSQSDHGEGTTEVRWIQYRHGTRIGKATMPREHIKQAIALAAVRAMEPPHDQ